MKISGTITINDHNNQQRILQADDFVEVEHLDGNSKTYNHDTGDYSIEIVVENRNGVLSQGDWQTENCSVVKDNITFSLH